jgi:hypothetical protein
MLQVDYTLNREDVLRAFSRLRASVLREAGRAPDAVALRVLGIAAAVCFGVFTAMAISGKTPVPVWGLLAAAAVHVLSLQGLQRAMGRHVDELLTAEASAAVGPRRLAIDADGVRLDSPAAEIFLPWSSVRGAETDAADVWIDGRRGLEIQVPRRAVDEPAARAILDAVAAHAALRPEPSGRAPAAPAAPYGLPAAMPPTNAGVLRSLWRNLRNGVRIATFRQPLLDAADTTLGGAVAVAAAAIAIALAFDVAAVGLDGRFNAWGLPAAFFFVAASVGGAALMNALGPRGRTGIDLLVCLIALWTVVQTAGIAVHAALDALAPPQAMWRVIEWLQTAQAAWFAAAATLAAIRIAGIAGIARRGAALATAAVIALALQIGTPLDGLWSPRYDEDGDDDRARMALAAEQAFYQQPRLLERELSGIAPGRKGVVDLYFVGAAGYANQDVFMREVQSVGKLFAERFDTAGRSVSLINNGRSVMETPVASLTSLRRALARVGGAMDRDEDVLFLFLTSHGSRSHELSLDFWPLRFDRLGPGDLKAALDDAGIKWRVIVVSACYSGGFVQPLADEHTIVITAAAADRNSFGCSNEADFTYFGKAYFDQALRETHSFVAAFDRARALVAEREAADGYTPSDPQIRAGTAIRTHLLALETRLAQGTEAPRDVAASAARDPYVLLTKSLDLPARLKAVQAGCRVVSSATGPEWTFRRAPDWFGGMRPGTAPWMKLVAAHEELYETSCDAVDPVTWETLHVSGWGEHLSAEHADAVLAFLAGDAGRAFLAAFRETEAAAQRESVRIQTAALRSATERYIAQLRAIQGEAPAAK